MNNHFFSKRKNIRMVLFLVIVCTILYIVSIDTVRLWLKAQQYKQWLETNIQAVNEINDLIVSTSDKEISIVSFYTMEETGHTHQIVGVEILHDYKDEIELIPFIESDFYSAQRLVLLNLMFNNESSNIKFFEFRSNNILCANYLNFFIYLIKNGDSNVWQVVAMNGQSRKIYVY